MANPDVELEEVAINVDPIKSLLDLVEEGRKRGNLLQPSICMVPRIYRDQNPNCFDPRMVSIGPIHSGHKNIQQHEGLKGAYMHDLLARLDPSPAEDVMPGRIRILQTCHTRVSSSIDRIKSCYAWKDKNLQSDDNIAKMMVTDACFILEFIQKISEFDASLYSENMFMGNSIFTDLILIENQIPFFVLQDIFDLTLSKVLQQNDTLITLLLPVLTSLNPFQAELQIHDHSYDFKHILEILHKCFQPRSFKKYDNIKICRSAVELDQAGLKFKPNQDGNWTLAMEYESSWPFRSLGKPTLRMPIFTINAKTEILLRNLIAYEQSYPSNVNCHYFTSFAVAMDMLVDSPEDVIKLVESQVIVNDLGSNEIAANMINRIGNEVTHINFIYSEQWQKLDDYYKSHWNKNMAQLKRTYFSSPWSIIALVAGFLLFALTAIQTFFTVKSALN